MFMYIDRNHKSNIELYINEITSGLSKCLKGQMKTKCASARIGF